MFLFKNSKVYLETRQGQTRDMIAIYSTNRYEYDAIIFGVYQAFITNVALYDTLTAILKNKLSFFSFNQVINQTMVF